jgi:hypothetical protein
MTNHQTEHNILVVDIKEFLHENAKKKLKKI